MPHVLQELGLGRVINAAGTMTSLGASRTSPEVAARVAEILQEFVEIDRLQERASRSIAAATGAEAGFVASSAAAGLMLAAGAALAGGDPAAVEDLPGTRGRPRRIGLPMGHMVNYGAPVAQALAVAGAEVVPIGTAARCETYHLEARLREGLVAAAYVVSHHTVREGELPLALYVEMCREHGVPVIVDMASEYDLRGAIALGAAVAVWSGHKFLGGPTSGIVAGSRAMIGAMYLQNLGIGRLAKVGKEGIAGAIAALEAWGRRDHAAARRREEAIAARWAAALAAVPGVSARLLPDWTGNPITRVEVRLAPAEAGLFAWELAARLMARDPAVAVRADHAAHQVLHLDPCNVTEAEAELVAAAVVETCARARSRGDGCARPWVEEKRARGNPLPDWLR